MQEPGDQVSSKDGSLGPQLPSNGEHMTERLRRSRLLPGQFRFALVILASTMVAIVLGAVRLSGVGYDRFFVFFLLVAVTFLPSLSWFLTALMGIRSRRRRYSIALSVTGVCGLAMLVFVALLPLRDTQLGMVPMLNAREPMEKTEETEQFLLSFLRFLCSNDSPCKAKCRSYFLVVPKRVISPDVAGHPLLRSLRFVFGVLRRD